MRRAILIGLACAASALEVCAQGADACSSAATTSAIQGAGFFGFSNTGATSSSITPYCEAIADDVWFYWTATASGRAVFSTCGSVLGDSVIAAYADGAVAGTCLGSNLACDDDGACAFASEVNFSCAAGSSYFLQLGSYPSTGSVFGTFELQVFAPPANDACATPAALAGPGTYSFDLRGATTGTQGQNELACSHGPSAALERDAWWTFTAVSTGEVTLRTCGQTVPAHTPMVLAVYAGTGCPGADAIACSSSSCALVCVNWNHAGSASVSWFALAGSTYTIQIGERASAIFGLLLAVSGTFTIQESAPACSPTAAYACVGNGTGTACPCGNTPFAYNGCPNSVWLTGARLDALGQASIAADTLRLSASSLPASTSWALAQGTTLAAGGQGFVAGDGLRCLTGTVVRIATRAATSSGFGDYPHPGDVPISIRGACTAGSTRVYQIQYRDPSATFCTPATFNWTAGLYVTWVP